MTNLSFLFEISHHPRNLLDGNLRIDTVLIVEINIVRPESLE